MRTLILFSLLGLLYLSGSLYLFWKANLPLISPLDLIESLSPLSPAFRSQGTKTVFGFLPYWNMKNSQELNIRPLTHLAYFAVDIKEDGSIRKYEKPGEIEPGWRKLNSSDFTTLARQIRFLNKKLILTVTAMEKQQIESIVNEETARRNAVNSILLLMSEKQFDGVNIDFEYMGYPGETTRENFTRFVEELTSRCKLANRRCEISLDVFADSAVKNRLYDLKRIGSIVDQVIVMAYDFYRASSHQSGPVAPLRGKCANLAETECFDYDVVTSIGDIAKLVPARKIVLGVPFYGYEWQTVDADFLSRTFPDTGGVATYKRIQSLFTDENISSLSAKWSNLSFTPYLTYLKDDNTYQVHYEDQNSLRLKIDFVHQAKLAGLAVWAVGYELPYQGLWQTISESL